MGQELSTPSKETANARPADDGDKAATVPVEEITTKMLEIPELKSTSFSVSSSNRKKKGDGKPKLNVALLHETIGLATHSSRASRKSYRFNKDENSILAPTGEEESTCVPTPNNQSVPNPVAGQKEQAKRKADKTAKSCASERDVEILYEELLDKHADFLLQKLKLKYACDGSSVASMSYAESVRQNPTDNPSILSDAGESFLTDVAHCPGGADATATSRERRLYFRRMYEEQQAIQKLALIRQMIQAEYESADSETSSKVDDQTINVKPLLDEISLDLIERARSGKDGVADSSGSSTRRSTNVTTNDQNETVVDKEEGSKSSKKSHGVSKTSVKSAKSTVVKAEQTDWDEGSKTSTKSPGNHSIGSKSNKDEELKTKSSAEKESEPDWDEGSKTSTKSPGERSVCSKSSKHEDSKHSKKLSASCRTGGSNSDSLDPEEVAKKAVEEAEPDWDEESKTFKEISLKELVLIKASGGSASVGSKQSKKSKNHALSDWESNISTEESKKNIRLENSTGISNGGVLSNSFEAAHNADISNSFSNDKPDDRENSASVENIVSTKSISTAMPEERSTNNKEQNKSPAASIASWSKSNRASTAFSPYNPDDDSTVASKRSGRNMRVKSITWSVDKQDDAGSRVTANLDAVELEAHSTDSSGSDNPAGHNTSVGDSPEIMKQSFDWSEKKSNPAGHNTSVRDSLEITKQSFDWSDKKNNPAGHNTSDGDSPEIMKQSFDWSEKKSKMSIAEINDDESMSSSAVETRDTLAVEKRSQDASSKREASLSDQPSAVDCEAFSRAESEKSKNSEMESSSNAKEVGKEDKMPDSDHESDDSSSSSSISSKTSAPDYDTIFGSKSVTQTQQRASTKLNLRIDVDEPNRPHTRSVFDKLDSPSSATIDDGDVDVRFVEQYEDLFQEFLFEKPQFMDRDPELLGFLKVVKLQKILEASADTEQNLERKIEVIEHQKSFMSKKYHSQLMEASQKKVRRELELEQELTHVIKDRKTMEANLTWKRIAATDTRAKRQQRILADFSDREANEDSIVDVLPDLPETELLKKCLTSTADDDQDLMEKDLVHYQVDNSLLHTETMILDHQSQVMFEDAKKHAWVDSIFMQMKDKDMTKLKEMYGSKMGVDL